jgi:hypothetical protein
MNHRGSQRNLVGKNLHPTSHKISFRELNIQVVVHVRDGKYNRLEGVWVE